MLVAVLHSLLFDVTTHPFVSYIAGILHPFYNFSPAHRRLIRDTFILTFPDPSFTVLSRALRFWEGIFYLKAFFTLRSFPTFLPQPAFIKASLRAGSFSLTFAGLHADSRNTGLAYLFIWFTETHNLKIQKNLYLNHTKYYHELLVVKSLGYLLLARFELFSLVQSICKDYKKNFVQGLYYL